MSIRLGSAKLFRIYQAYQASGGRLKHQAEMNLGKVVLLIVLAAFPVPAFAQGEKDNITCSHAFPEGSSRYATSGVGKATMLSGGTICVLYNPFKGETDDKPAAMLLVYSPSRPSYSLVKKEIGSLKPGQTKLIPRYLKTYPAKGQAD